MPCGPWHDDDDLLTELAEVAGRSSMPDSMRRAALAAFDTRRTGGILAKIRYDSLLDVLRWRDEAPADGASSASRPRTCRSKSKCSAIG